MPSIEPTLDHHPGRTSYTRNAFAGDCRGAASQPEARLDNVDQAKRRSFLLCAPFLPAPAQCMRPARTRRDKSCRPLGLWNDQLERLGVCDVIHTVLHKELVTT